MNEFKDKVAVVTGSASGIVRGIAGTFTATGMNVVLKRHRDTGARGDDSLTAMHDILTGNNPAVVPSPELMQKLNPLRLR